MADRLNDWMFDSIRPYLKGKILEIGSGIGNISNCLIKNGLHLSVSDYSDYYCSLLDKKFGESYLLKESTRLTLLI